MSAENSSIKILEGGNMGKPLLKDNRIYKNVSEASLTIHKLLKHVQKKGVDWVPESFGINDEGKHVLSYINGFVPNENPDWIWNEDILFESAIKLRQWHDATEDFNFQSAKWLLKNNEPDEVICHCDFAPYNCVFRDKKLIGVIDFDVCAPGSRLWDISYAVYRFVPLLPQNTESAFDEYSPFSKKHMLSRLELFIKQYNQSDQKIVYDMECVIQKVKLRLLSLARWSEAFGRETGNNKILENAKMYTEHAHWVTGLIL